MKVKEFDSDYVFKELCRRVGLPYPLPTGQKYGVDAATWTLEKERDFREWLVKYCNSIPKIQRRGKRWIDHEVGKLMFRYSWKCK